MNLKNIKLLLSNDEIPAEKINPIINTLSVNDLGQLSELETRTLNEVLSNMFILIQDPSSGAHIEDLEKANTLLAALK